MNTLLLVRAWSKGADLGGGGERWNLNYIFCRMGSKDVVLRNNFTWKLKRKNSAAVLGWRQAELLKPAIKVGEITGLNREKFFLGPTLFSGRRLIQ